MNCEIGSIIKLDQKFFERPWTKEMWSNLNFDKTQTNFYYLSKINHSDICVGFSLYLINKAESLAHLLKILVIPNKRGKGISSVQLKNDIKYFQSLFIEKIYLEVSTKNLNAIKFYKKHSFVTLRYTQKFYNNGDDAFVMELPL